MHIPSNISDQFTLKLMAQSQLEEANHQMRFGKLTPNPCTASSLMLTAPPH